MRRRSSWAARGLVVALVALGGAPACSDDPSTPALPATGAAGAGGQAGGSAGSGGSGGAVGAGGGGGGPSCQFEPGPIPFVDWPTGSPSSEGVSEPLLDAMWVELEARGTLTLLVVRHDAVIYERYGSGYSRTAPHYTASLAKALVGGMSLLVALTDGLIAPDDPVRSYVPEWTGVALKQDITVRHLSTHTSGIEDAEEGGLPHEQLTGWKGDFWARLDPPDDPFTISRELAPVLFAPGTDEHYSNPGMAMLSYAITDALQGEREEDLRSLLTARIMDPIGVPAAEWSCGYGETFQVAGLDLVAPWGGGSYSPNATARVGRLLMRCGDWDGQALLDPAWVVEATRYAGTPAPSGLAFWVNDTGDGGTVSPSLPTDAYWGAGAGNQILLVVPSLDLIAVRNGSDLVAGDFQGGLEQYLFAPLMAAIEDR